MKTKHTPGPWNYSISTPAQESAKYDGKNCGANCHIWANTDKLIFGRDPGKTICFPPHWRDETENTEQIANIKLIAAAPDLLDAAQSVLTTLEAMRKDTMNDGMIMVLQDAIKKATDL